MTTASAQPTDGVRWSVWNGTRSQPSRRTFAPGGLDAALVLASGKTLGAALTCVKKGGRIAYPNGVHPVPKGEPGVEIIAYDGMPGREAFERLNRLIGAGPFHVELARTYRLDEAAKAHRELGKHHLGKLALRIH